MRKVFGALLALASIFGGLTAGTPTVSAAGNYIVSINDATAAEGSPETFTISLQQVIQSGDTVTVQATTSDGTAAGAAGCTADYVSRSSTVTLNAANPTGTFVVQTCDDAAPEPSETFFVTLSNPTANCGTDTPCSATIGDGSGTGTITDNEPAPATPSPSPSPSPSPNPNGSPAPGGTGPTTLTVVDVVGPVGPHENCKFSVNREGTASGTSTVVFATAGKARLITNVTGTLVFGPGETVKTIDVDVLHRPRHQKHVTLLLSSATNAAIIDGIGVCELKERRHRR